MVAEKEGLSPHKGRPPQLQEPLRQAKRTKKQLSDGFTIKAMMKNTVVGVIPSYKAFPSLGFTEITLALTDSLTLCRMWARAGVTIVVGMICRFFFQRDTP